MTTFTGKQAGKLIELFADTPSDQVQAIYGSGLLTDLRDADISKVDREEFRRVLGLKPLNPPLLDPVSTHIVSRATTEPFIANKKFKLKKNGGICSYLGDNFKSWFLGKTEAAKGETMLDSARLTRNSLDKPILAELGDKAETTLTELSAMMEAQADGKEGDLLVDGYANIFYVRDTDNVLCAVSAYWDDDGWHVYADSVVDPRDWVGGHRVFSRNS